MGKPLTNVVTRKLQNLKERLIEKSRNNIDGRESFPGFQSLAESKIRFI